MTRHIETDTASNVNISSATAIGTYTADGDRLIVVDVCIDAVTGNGDYVMYITKKIGGAGSAYVILPKTVMTAANGETAISYQSGLIAVRSGDILTVYVDGLAGDTTTPDYTTRWFESDALVTLGATQGAITWGQQKIIANVANQGALDILNSNASGYGQQNRGYQGLRNYSDVANGAGQANISSQTGGKGLQNYTSGANGISQQNSAVGDSGIAFQAYASGASSVGQQVVGVAASISGTLSTVTNVTNVTNAVKISTGTGAGQLDVVSGVVKANLAQILGTALTETAGLIAAGFKKFFNVATPTGTINSLPDAVPGTGGGLATTLHVQEVEDKVDTIDGIVDAVKAKTDLITTGTVITVTSPVSGSTITAIRGDTLVAVLEGIGSLADCAKLWLTVKADESDPDSAALIQIEKTAGLLYINGAAATVPANGSITINDEPTGDITITLAAVELAKLSPGQYHYDIQILRSTGIAVSTLTSDTFIISADYTKATS